MFDKKDTNKDDFLTFDEFKHGRNEKFLQNAEKRFQTLDTNQDDKVSLDELKAGWAGMTRNKKKWPAIMLRLQNTGYQRLLEGSAQQLKSSQTVQWVPAFRAA